MGESKEIRRLRTYSKLSYSPELRLLEIESLNQEMLGIKWFADPSFFQENIQVFFPIRAVWVNEIQWAWQNPEIGKIAFVGRVTDFPEYEESEPEPKPWEIEQIRDIFSVWIVSGSVIREEPKGKCSPSSVMVPILKPIDRKGREIFPLSYQDRNVVIEETKKAEAAFKCLN